MISILRPTFDQEKTKFCKQQKIGGFEYFGDSDVVNKLEAKIFQTDPSEMISPHCV